MYNYTHNKCACFGHTCASCIKGSYAVLCVCLSELDQYNYRKMHLVASVRLTVNTLTEKKHKKQEPLPVQGVCPCVCNQGAYTDLYRYSFY